VMPFWFDSDSSNTSLNASLIAANLSPFHCVPITFNSWRSL
jgi:hypothetical protein